MKESPKAKDLIYHAYCDEGFVNTPKKKGLESFWTGEHMEILGGGGSPERAWELYPLFPHTGFMHLFHLALLSIYNKPGTW